MPGSEWRRGDTAAGPDRVMANTSPPTSLPWKFAGKLIVLTPQYAAGGFLVNRMNHNCVPDFSHRTSYAPSVRTSGGKIYYFSLEAITSFATTFYLYYLYFLMRDEFGFSTRANLWLTALHGLIYVFGSWQSGKFIQRRGCFPALKLGFLGMTAGLALGASLPGAAGQIIGLVVWTLPLCLIWPALETLVTTGEDYAGTARMVGRYNVVWAAANAVAFFTGGWLWEQLGRSGLYGICITLMLLQGAFTFWLATAIRPLPAHSPAAVVSGHVPEAVAFRQNIPPRRFLHLAWLANPFAYVASNTLGATIPQLAERFALSPTQSGMFCSLWFFGRVAAFIVLWHWTGWHYRFRWLLGAFVALLLGFGLTMLAGQFWLVLAGQLLFGLAIGLIYYSSLFYSMDVGEAKGEQGGYHEAAIGLGVCLGPATGAAALQFWPQLPNAGTWAVGGLLTLGLGALLQLRLKSPR